MRFKPETDRQHRAERRPGSLVRTDSKAAATRALTGWPGAATNCSPVQKVVGASVEFGVDILPQGDTKGAPPYEVVGVNLDRASSLVRH